MEQVLGGDYRAFCDEVAGAFPKRTAGQRALEWLDGGSTYWCVIMLVWLGKHLLSAAVSGEGAWALPLTLGEVLAGAEIVLAAVALVERICRTALEPARPRRRGHAVLLWLGLMALMGGITGTTVLLSRPVWILPWWGWIALILLPALLGAGVRRWGRY